MTSPLKKPLGIDVLTAARQRIKIAFDRFEKLYISFSGGKDSTVLLHLVMEEAIKQNRKIGVLFIDLEGQYRGTIEHSERCFDMYKDHIDPMWVALPLHLRNAVSQFEPFWLCFDPDYKENWIRSPPDFAITNECYFPFFKRGMEFEEFIEEFAGWYGGGKSCGAFIGIRSDESLNRFRTLVMDKKKLDNYRWTTWVTAGTFNTYPIYDWRTEDIWVFSAKFKKPQNPIYELMHKAGVPLSHQRICQPYGDDQRRGLWLFHLLEPETWAKVVARVNGANSGSLYAQDTGNISGVGKITKPDGHNWESFAHFLLSSMPEKTSEHYKNKISIFIKWHLDRDFPEGIPDEGDPKLEANRKIPSWRRICKALLRNDYWCKGLSFSQQKSGGYERYLALMAKRRDKWKII